MYSKTSRMIGILPQYLLNIFAYFSLSLEVFLSQILILAAIILKLDIIE